MLLIMAVIIITVNQNKHCQQIATQIRVSLQILLIYTRLTELSKSPAISKIRTSCLLISCHDRAADKSYHTESGNTKSYTSCNLTAESRPKSTNTILRQFWTFCQ